MEAIIDKANADDQKIDAVLAENDSTALGVVAALKAKSYAAIPVSGQDGDTANLQNVAAGLQYVDVWKNANELGKAAGAAALQLCKGTKMADLALPDGLVLPRQRSGSGQQGPGLHHAGWQHRQVVHPERPADHRRRTSSSSSTPSGSPRKSSARTRPTRPTAAAVCK